MKTICHVIHSLTVGGAARTMVATAKYSRQLAPRFEHKLVMLNLQHSDPSAARFAMEEGLVLPPARTREALLQELASADIVQVNWWQHPEMDAFLRGALPPCRLLGWFHCAGDRAPQLLHRSLVELFDRVIAGSSYTFGAPAINELPATERARKCDFVIGGADFARLEGLQREPHDSFNVGYIGTVNFVKMHKDYLSLHANVSLPNLKVIVCGGDMQLALAAEAADRGWSERFDFRGYVSDIRPVLGILDVYGYPLCEDTYAASELNLQEAMFAGIPPVVFPHGGLKTLVTDNLNGLVVNSNEEYSKAIEYLHNHPEDRRRLGENAATTARKEFGAANQAAKMNAIYQRLLLEPKRQHIWPGYVAPGTPKRKLSGAEIFLETLDDAAPEYQLSFSLDSLDELVCAEERIMLGTTLMRQAGVHPFYGSYASSPHLALWTGLLYLGADRAAEAAPFFLAAIDQGLAPHGYRALWYLALAASRCNEQQLLRDSLVKLLEIHPNFRPASELLDACVSGAPVLTTISLSSPHFLSQS